MSGAPKERVPGLVDVPLGSHWKAAQNGRDPGHHPGKRCVVRRSEIKIFYTIKKKIPILTLHVLDVCAPEPSPGMCLPALPSFKAHRKHLPPQRLFLNLSCILHDFSLQIFVFPLPSSPIALCTLLIHSTCLPWCSLHLPALPSPRPAP